MRIPVVILLAALIVSGCADSPTSPLTPDATVAESDPLRGSFHTTLRAANPDEPLSRESPAALDKSSGNLSFSSDYAVDLNGFTALDNVSLQLNGQPLLGAAFIDHGTTTVQYGPNASSTVTATMATSFQDIFDEILPDMAAAHANGFQAGTFSKAAPAGGTRPDREIDVEAVIKQFEEKGHTVKRLERYVLQISRSLKPTKRGKPAEFVRVLDLQNPLASTSTMYRDGKKISEYLMKRDDSGRLTSYTKRYNADGKAVIRSNQLN